MNKTMKITPAVIALCAFGCSSDYESDAILSVKDIVSSDIDNLTSAAQGIQDNAPTADDDGWNATDDADAVSAMRSEWHDARVAYERIEGAIAVLFPDLDASTDERYDGFIGEAADDNLFDGEGVTGVHAIERILWADSHSDTVLAFESSLSDYTVAAFPTTLDEADDFKTGLAQRFIDDATLMGSDFEFLAFDVAVVYEGVVGSMAEQVEKITLAYTGEAESRYAGHTLADMRANLEGGLAIYDAFSEWIIADGGEDLDTDVRDGFDRVMATYDAFSGDALPAVPENWNPDSPSDEDLATDYGVIWSMLDTESNPDVDGSLVSSMVEAASTIGIEVAL